MRASRGGRAWRRSSSALAALALLACSRADGASGITPLTLGSARPSPSRPFDAHIAAAAALHGVRPELVRAVIEAESAFDRKVVSPAGAAGLMQLMPATARRFGVTDPFDARQNIFAGTQYLRLLLDTHGGNVSLAAAAYNAGETAVARYKGMPPYRATRAYVRRVNALLAAHASPAPVALLPTRAQAAPPPQCSGPALGWPLMLLVRPCARLGGRYQPAFAQEPVEGARTRSVSGGVPVGVVGKVQVLPGLDLGL